MFELSFALGPGRIRVFRRSLWTPIPAAYLLVGSTQAQLLRRYDFSAGANDSVGAANGALVGSATISGSLNTIAAVGGLSGGVPQNALSS